MKKLAKEQVADGFAGKMQKIQQSDGALIKELHGESGQLTVEKFFTTSLHQNLSCGRRSESVCKEHPVLSVRRQSRIL